MTSTASPARTRLWRRSDRWPVAAALLALVADAVKVATRIADRLAGLTVEFEGVEVSVDGRVGLAWTTEPIDGADLMACADDRPLAAKRDRSGPRHLITAAEPAID